MRATETALADERTAVFVALAVCCAPAWADDEKEPVTDMEFLEYLGSWDETDEEWQLLDGVIMAEQEEASVETTDDGAPETENEG